MIMIIVFILGLYTLADMPKEESPATEFGAFYISVSYRGVSPEDMEKLVVKKIEDELSDLDDVDFISSTASEGSAVIFIRMEAKADIDKAWDELNTEMEKVHDLPAGANDPIITRLNMREVNSICTLTLGGDFSDNALREMADDFKDELLEVNFISKVEIAGTRDRQIWIDTDITKLTKSGLSLTDLSKAITDRNQNSPGGSIKVGYADFLIRTMGEFESLEEIPNVFITMDSKGGAIRIDDVATVRDTLEETETMGKLNGQKAVTLDVYKDADGNIISVMKDIRAAATKFQSQFEGLSVNVRNDDSIRVKNSINTLSSNGLMGIVLVFVILWIFIGWQNALFAAWGIPFSFLLTFILMNQFGVTINNLSLFGLVLVLGMIVDDAIIVLENMHRYREMGYSVKEAAIKGTEEIMWPVIAAVSTTIAAFAPLLLMEGGVGKFMSVFPIVISLALLASLFESLVILPSHAAEFSSKKLKHHDESKHPLHEWLVTKYRKTVKKALRHRLSIIAVLLVTFLLSVLILISGLVKFQFFARSKPKTISLNLETPAGTSLEVTNEIVTQIENYIFTIPEKDDIESLVTTVGQYEENHRTNVESRNANIKIDLVDLDDMKFTHEQIKNSIRQYLENLPGLYNFAFKDGERGGPAGNEIEIRIKGDNMDRLEVLSDYVISEIEKIPGTTDLESSFSEGKKEIRIQPKMDKLAYYGLTVQSVSTLVAYASYGVTISTYRGSGMDEYDVVLRVKNDQINDLNDLENLPVRTSSGALIALKEVADLNISAGYSVIEHRDRKRLITITGSVSTYNDNGVVKLRSADEVTNMLRGSDLTGESGILANFSERFPGYSIEYGGQAEQQKEVSRSLYLALGVALLLVFSILATQFKSVVQPFIVMLTIPFAFIGVILGLLITGLPFSMMTLISVVALAGVVVNDALVLVDFVNRERVGGTDRWNSLINAGAVRLRPIIMTTATTIAGFLPIIFSTSSNSADYKPMAVSIAFGLVFSTFLTLFVIPVIYSLVDSLFGKLGMTRFKMHEKYEDCVKMDD